jgi:hypothetical protein
MTDQQKIEHYLSAFRAALRSMPHSEEIVREISAHIRDAAEEPGATLSAVLTRLGSPEALARQYDEAELFKRARRSFSPPLLLQAALRLSTKGILGIVPWRNRFFPRPSVCGAQARIASWPACWQPTSGRYTKFLAGGTSRSHSALERCSSWSPPSSFGAAFGFRL